MLGIERLPGAPFMTVPSSWVGFTAPLNVRHRTSAGNLLQGDSEQVSDLKGRGFSHVASSLKSIGLQPLRQLRGLVQTFPRLLTSETPRAEGPTYTRLYIIRKAVHHQEGCTSSGNLSFPLWLVILSAAKNPRIPLLPGAPFMTVPSSWVGFTAPLNVRHRTSAGNLP